MSDQSASFQLMVLRLFEAALQDYESQTDIELANHPLAERLQDCDSVEPITAILYEKAQGFNGKEDIMKPLKNVVSSLCKLSTCAKLGEVIGKNFSPVEAVYSGLGVLLSAIGGAKDGYAIIELLESIEHTLYHLDIYTEITPSVTMTEVLVKILVELLSTLALATKQIKQGRLKKFVKPIGEKYNEAVLQRLNRLTQDEAKLTAVQILEVVHGLVQNMRVVTDDGKASLDCVQNALETMNQITSNMNKMKRDKLERDVREWLSPPDPWKNHSIARRSQHGGTAKWFVQGHTFSAWKSSDPSSHLWIHGKPGAGKSVLCSSIIEDVMAMQKAGLASLAFFYCDFREDQKRDIRGLLSSLLVQLCHQSDSYCDILFKFYSDYADGSRAPSDDALAGCLKNLIKLPGHAPVYVIVDALDECPNTSAIPSPCDEVLNLIEQLINSQFPNLRICVTSRPETHIKDILNSLTFRSVSLHDEDGQKRDIEDYIESVIYTHPKIRMWEAGHKQLAMDVLKEEANGMPKWVDSQLAYMCGCMPARIQHALADLPETLDGTYQRILQEINKAEWELAHRLFQFVAVASRPLRVEEATDLLAIDFDAGPIPKFYEDWRLEDPEEAIPSTCRSLLTIVDRGRPVGKVVLFSHFSVKEFLTSARLAEANDPALRRYHVSMTAAHNLVSRACLGVLQHSPETFPLAEYSAEHLVDHTRFKDVSLNMENGLFGPSKRHFPVSLHDAAAWGLHSVVKLLVIGHLQDVHSRSLIDNATPLHFASKHGHLSVTRFLLERGAYVTAKNKDGETPLHLASRWGHLEVDCMLINYGADLTVQNKDLEVPLHVASRGGHVDVARMLLKHGAALTALNKDWETPLHVASREGQVQVARILLEHGAGPTARNKDGETPLHLALREGHVEVACVLTEYGADVSAQDVGGCTPLHLVSREGQAEITRLLIKHGAHVPAQEEDGWAPLHLASFNNQVENTRLLIEHSTDMKAKNSDNETPLQLVSTPCRDEVSP